VGERRHGTGQGVCARARRRSRTVAGRGRRDRMSVRAPSLERAGVATGRTQRPAGYSFGVGAPAQDTTSSGGPEVTMPGAAAPGGAPADELRIGDVDRERVVGRLCAAAGAGRLTLDEVAERQAAAYAARYSRELAALLVDLPAEEPDAAPPRTARVGRALLRDAVRAILVINSIALCVGLSPIPGIAGVVAVLSGITIAVTCVAAEVVRRQHRGELPARARAGR
jgi:uncharacterized protein DUF1707